MAIGSNSYGTVDEVKALTRAYLRGQTTFNSTTRPTLTEVEKFIDRASGVLNVAIANAGAAIPITQADAKLACDEWVVMRAVQFVEASQPYAGLDDNPRLSLFTQLQQDAATFIKTNLAAFGALGISQPSTDSNAVLFTGETVQADRSDPDDTSLEQPKFRRGQFDS